MRITRSGWVSHRRWHGSDFLEYWTFYGTLQFHSIASVDSAAFLRAQHFLKPDLKYLKVGAQIWGKHSLTTCENFAVWFAHHCQQLASRARDSIWLTQVVTHSLKHRVFHLLPEHLPYFLVLSSHRPSHWKTIQITSTINKKLLSKYSVCLTSGGGGSKNKWSHSLGESCSLCCYCLLFRSFYLILYYHI